MNSNPLCLIAVPTFGRPQFLPRILSCFSKLDYDNKRLLIINDDPDCKYVTSEDNVEIVNLDKQVSLAIKRNLFPSWEFDIMFPLDDDDLFLPGRLKNHILEYQKNPSIDLYRNLKSVGCNGGTIHVRKHPPSFTNSSFTRKGYFKSGGYTSFHQSNHDDVNLRTNFKKNCNVKIESNIDTCDFFYQFDGGRYHNTNNRDVIMSDGFRQRAEKYKITGTIELCSDHKTYDDIVDIINESIITLNRIPIIVENYGASIIRK
jgi:hypothetical protein